MKRTKKKRSIWVRLWLTRRRELGQYSRLMKELKKEDVKGFKNFMRMDYDLFVEILRRVEYHHPSIPCSRGQLPFPDVWV